MPNAYVVTGAVIISDDGQAQVKYHSKCPYCGKVNEGTTYGAHISAGIHANLASVFCYSCKKSFTVQINRDCR